MTRMAYQDLNYGDDFYTADNADQLKDVFKTIVNEINKETTSFVAPGISINAFNRLFNLNDIYFSLFRPDDRVGWLGNMKKFKLCEEKNSDTCSFGEVIDKNGNPAVYSDITNLDAYGTLKPEAQGFWSDPTDSAPEINQGGAGVKIPPYTERKVYVNTSSGAVTPPTDFSNVKTTGTALHPIDLTSNDVDGPGTADDPTSFTGLKAALRDQGNCTTGTFAEQNACLNDLIYWMKGEKFPGDLPRHGNDSDVDRWAFGDPMHSRPLVLTYGKDDATGTILSKIFVGTNDGGIRMLNEGNGIEEWIFYPNSMLSLQSSLKGNPNGTHLYGVDATPTARIRNVNGDGIIDPTDGDFVDLYFGLRRGGRQIFALNVTPDSEVIGVTDNDGNVVGKQASSRRSSCGASTVPITKFTRLGQTWSTPRPVRIAGANGPRTVLIFGGGYDTRQDGTDTDGTSPDGGDIYNNSSNGDSMGNAIFIVDADTGERLWWASSSSDGNGDAPDALVSSMNTSIPAPITPLDTNEDGLTDRLYAVDLRGQVFRVDLAVTKNATTGESDFSSSTVGVLARLGTDTTNAGPPEVLLRTRSRPRQRRGSGAGAVRADWYRQRQSRPASGQDRSGPRLRGARLPDRQSRRRTEQHQLPGLQSLAHRLHSGNTHHQQRPHGRHRQERVRDSPTGRWDDFPDQCQRHRPDFVGYRPDQPEEQLRLVLRPAGRELRLSGSEPAADRGEGLLDRNGAGWTGVLDHLLASGRDYRHHGRVLGTRGHRYVEVLCGRLLHRSAGLRPERG